MNISLVLIGVVLLALGVRTLILTRTRAHRYELLGTGSPEPARPFIASMALIVLGLFLAIHFVH